MRSTALDLASWLMQEPSMLGEQAKTGGVLELLGLSERGGTNDRASPTLHPAAPVGQPPGS
jgi:hypothetical protein